MSTQDKGAYFTVMHTEFVSMGAAADSGKCNTCNRYVIILRSEVSLSEGNFLDYFLTDIFFYENFWVCVVTGATTVPEGQVAVILSACTYGIPSPSSESIACLLEA
jgi:hypothetical protein